MQIKIRHSLLASLFVFCLFFLSVSLSILLSGFSQIIVLSVYSSVFICLYSASPLVSSSASLKHIDGGIHVFHPANWLR